jgi:hypothetical protein
MLGLSLRLSHTKRLCPGRDAGGSSDVGMMLRREGESKDIIDMGKGIAMREMRMEAWRLRWHSIAAWTFGVYSFGCIGSISGAIAWLFEYFESIFVGALVALAVSR